ncbi:dihydrofolate reductase [Corynebacterium choanae]|uniref:dihydrofolate reductase n=1 Tax=Corynebacterium choanae TaxID=1862358 RepID=UPI000F514949
MHAIWAQSRDGVIGDGTTMPWNVPEDLAHFKHATLGHPVLMGRRTWESLPARFRPLPGRENFVLSTTPAGDWSTGATVTTALPSRDTVWVIGGGQVYAALLAQCTHVLITKIDTELGEVLGTTAVTAPPVPAAAELVAQSPWLSSDTGQLSHDPARSVRYQIMHYQLPR